MEENKKCPYCGQTITSIAVICPHCGVSLTKQVKKKSKTKIFMTIIAVIFLLLIVSSIFGSDSEDSEITMTNTSAPDNNNSDNNKIVSDSNSDNTTSETIAPTDSNAQEDIKKNTSNTEQKTNKKVSKKNFIKECKQYKYKNLMRNPDKYSGKKIKLTCQIYQVLESWGTLYYNVSTNNEYDVYLGDNMIVYDERKDTEKPKLLEDDIITVYGTFDGLEKQTSALLGTKSEYPAIKMKYVELINN